MAHKEAQSIIIVGDVTIDWYAYEVPPSDGDTEHTYNWKLQPGTNMVAAPGGVLLLAELIQLATSRHVNTHSVKKICSGS